MSTLLQPRDLTSSYICGVIQNVVLLINNNAVAMWSRINYNVSILTPQLPRCRIWQRSRYIYADTMYRYIFHEKHDNLGHLGSRKWCRDTRKAYIFSTTEVLFAIWWTEKHLLY